MNQEQQRAYLYSLTSMFDVAAEICHHFGSMWAQIDKYHVIKCRYDRYICRGEQIEFSVCWSFSV